MTTGSVFTLLSRIQRTSDSMPATVPLWDDQMMAACANQDPPKLWSLIETRIRNIASVRIDAEILEHLVVDTQAHASDLLKRRYSPFALVDEIREFAKARGIIL